MAEFEKVLLERSSIRAYKAEPLSRELIETVVNAGLAAPTARNEQEVRITVVNGTSPLLREIQEALNPNAKTNFYYNAPVVFFLSGRDDFARWSRLDAGIAVENMHLAAKNAGLGSVILGCVLDVLRGEKKAYFNEKLGIPAGYSFEIALAVGYPDTEKVPHVTEAATHVVYVD